METKPGDGIQSNAPGVTQETPGDNAPPEPVGPLHAVAYDPASPDAAVTDYLLECYTQEDGFHCPICHLLIEDPTQAVHHMAGELNAAFVKLAKEFK